VALRSGHAPDAVDRVAVQEGVSLKDGRSLEVDGSGATNDVPNANGNDDTKSHLALGNWHRSFRCPDCFDNALCCCCAGGLKAKGK
jgi:hypothetical protein